MTSRPNPTLTPGDWTDHRTVRNVPLALKAAVYRSYNIRLLRRVLYTIDHLVPLELNGTNSQRNLWPQPRSEAKAKDADENFYARQVATRRTSIELARIALLLKWAGR